MRLPEAKIVVIAAVAFVAVATVLAAGCGGTDGQQRGVTVPDLVGLNVVEATTLLEAHGLSWRFDGDDLVHSRGSRPKPGEVISPSPAANTVTGQKPDAGSVIDAGAIIDLRTECGDRAKKGRGCL